MRRLPVLLALAVPVAVAVMRRADDARTREAADMAARSGAAVPLPRERIGIGAAPDAHLVAREGEPPWVRDLARWVPEPPRTPLGRALAYAWAAPASLVGLLLGLLGGGTPQLRDGVVLFTGIRGPVGAALARGGFAATTLGHVVVSRREPSPQLMAHELAHTRQAERLGPLTGLVYWSLLLRYGYARHPMERAARRAGRAARLTAGS